MLRAMRPPITLLALTLASCGPQAVADNASVGGVANLAAPSDSGLAQYREDTLRGCIGGARDTVTDASVPVERHCACAVDRIMAGKTLAQLEDEERSGEHAPLFTTALRQCIREISPGYRPGRGR